MKKFYLAVLLTVSSLFLLSVNSVFAQPPYTAAETFENDGSLCNPCTLSTATWLNSNVPSILNPCHHCKIILNGDITIDLHVVLDGGSQVVLNTNSIVHLNQYAVALQGTEIDLLANSSLYVNDELDINDNSFITIVDGSAFINANNVDGFTGQTGPMSTPPLTAPPAGGGRLGPGIYYILDGSNLPNFGSYQVILNQFGWGDNTPAPDYASLPDPPGSTPPPPAGSRFFARYTINCVTTPFNTCVAGTIFGPATTAVNTDPFFTGNPIVSFTSGTTLPVTLVQFIAQRDNGNIKLSWATSTEINASHFDVERSGNGSSFDKIGTVQAKGFSSITTNYSFVDQQPLATTGYYRLKMVDLDGKFEYSKIITVSEGTKGESLVIYNNPYTDMIRLNINTNTPDNLSLTVTDVLGKIYLTQSVRAQSGDNFVNINPGGAPGMYILRIQGSKGYDRMVKLIKQ